MGASFYTEKKDRLHLTVKVRPCPTWLSTPIVPPWPSTRVLATDSPSPMPRALVVNSGSKIGSVQTEQMS